MHIVLGLLVAVAGVTATPPVAIEQEPLHHLLFENAVVKVLDVQVPAGATMAMHTHPNDHLAILLRGAKLRNEVQGEPPVDRFIGAPGTVIYLPAGPPHRQISLDDQTARWIAVELIGAAKPGRTEPVGPHYEDVLDNARVQVARLKLAPGERVDRFPFSAPYLQVAITPGEVEVASQHAGNARVSLPGGSAVWEDHRIQSLVNRGDHPLELVFLRIK